jgi:hypothetical protein
MTMLESGIPSAGGPSATRANDHAERGCRRNVLAKFTPTDGARRPVRGRGTKRWHVARRERRVVLESFSGPLGMTDVAADPLTSTGTRHERSYPDHARSR